MSSDLLFGEEWKKVPGFDNYYASTQGRIGSAKNLNYASQLKVLKFVVTDGGYCQYKFRQDNKYHTVKGHRAVALAFIPNPLQLLDVNHVDGNKQNNTPSNLQWFNQSKKVRIINTGEIFDSVGECATELGISRNIVYKVLQNRQKSWFNLRFEYVND